MIGKMDHIGIAVKNIDNVLALFNSVLGIKPTLVEKSSELGVKVAFVPIGNGEIEFIEPLDPADDLSKFMEKKGKDMCLHHICFQVPDVDQELQDMQAKGVKLVSEKSREGYAGKVGFLHPHAVGGLWVELVEKV